MGQSARHDETSRIVKEAADELQRLLKPQSVRIWRYVESQRALFGYHSLGPILSAADGRTTAFTDFVAFLRDRTKLPELASRHVADVSNKIDGTHPLWEVVPEYRLLPKACKEHFIESILMVPRDGQPANIDEDLVAVVCIDASYETYANHEKKAVIEQQLDRIKEALHKHSLTLFRDGFREAQPFLAGSIEPSGSHNEHGANFQKPLQQLLKAMGGDTATTSVYIRRVVNVDEDIVPLVDGIGTFYETLRENEDWLRSQPEPAEKRRDVFSFHAQERFLEHDDDEPLLFPGTGDSLTFRQYETWLIEAEQRLLQARPPDDPARNTMRDQATHVIHNGSFGVFPIRSSSDGGSSKGRLVALLCVANSERRYFFNWTRRLVIERFCRVIGGRHEADVAPLLTRVAESTHRELVGSQHVLGKLISTANPLIPQVDQRSCYAFVVSVDLRKSTDLMLRMIPDFAHRYADVMMKLCDRMRDAVKAEFGIFDKFTGDGILGFFPDLFSGNRRNAAARALRAAQQCHEAFWQSYGAFWPNVHSVPSPGDPDKPVAGRAGLGIGIDFGLVRLVNVGAELTVVGAPVVYACRLSSAAHAYATLLNYHAYHVVDLDGLSSFVECTPENVPIKNDSILAYSVKKRKELDVPTWALPKDKDSRDSWTMGL